MAANPKELIRESTVHSYKTLMDVSWNFDYEAGVPKIEDLYKRAKDNQWNADHLKWDTPIDPSNPIICLLYTSPSPRDGLLSRMPSSA